jgi:hypothetical protein
LVAQDLRRRSVNLGRSGLERVTIAVFLGTKWLRNREEIIPILEFCSATLTTTQPLPHVGNCDDADVWLDGALLAKGFS